MRVCACVYLGVWGGAVLVLLVLWVSRNPFVPVSRRRQQYFKLFSIIFLLIDVYDLCFFLPSSLYVRVLYVRVCVCVSVCVFLMTFDVCCRT